MKASTSQTQTAREIYDEAVAAAAEWAQAISDLQEQSNAANVRQASSPADLAAIANEQLGIERRLELAQATLACRQTDVITAAQSVVAAEADALQPAIDKTRNTIAAIDLKTAKLRQALDEHLAQTREARETAEREAAALDRRQRGLRAAVAGEPLREYFRTAADLPEVLHPETGVLYLPGYQADLDRVAEKAAYEQWRQEGQKVLDEVAAALKITDGLTVSRSICREPITSILDQIDETKLDSSTWDRTDLTSVRAARISAEALAAECDEPGYLEAFDKAAQYADADSFAEVVRALDRVRQAHLQAEAGEAEAERMRNFAAALREQDATNAAAAARILAERVS